MNKNLTPSIPSIHGLRVYGYPNVKGSKKWLKFYVMNGKTFKMDHYCGGTVMTVVSGVPMDAERLTNKEELVYAKKIYMSYESKYMMNNKGNKFEVDYVKLNPILHPTLMKQIAARNKRINKSLEQN